MRGGVGRKACVHGEDTGSAANIEDDLVLEEVGVLVDRVAVASCADLIFLHLAVSLCVLSYAGRKLGWDVPAFPRGCLYAQISRVHIILYRENEPWWL